MEFLSTLSLRRATSRAESIAAEVGDFYPRSPCGERLYDTYAKVLRVNISIHALLAESDNNLLTSVVSSADFYPRSPCGERLIDEIQLEFNSLISIHALLAESDYHIFDDISGATRHFYPRSPCGERLRCFNALQSLFAFLSTLSLRRATANAVDQILPGHISIHALLAESDFGPISVGFIGGLFLSTLSLRRATVFVNLGNIATTNFYPRSPCGERPEFIFKIR